MGNNLIKILSRGLLLSLFICSSLTIVTENSTEARPQNAPCPAGTVSIPGHKCLLALTGDATLTSTIVLDSRMILDCQGHALLPSVAGTVDDATTPANEYTPSQPDLAVFFNETVDAKIQNCVIGTEDAKFDFGVYALNSDRNAIKHNAIHVRTVGVHFINSSYNKLSENDITYGSEIGKGVHLNAKSEFNIIEGNSIISTGEDETSFHPVTGQVNIAGKVRDEPGTWTPFRAAGGNDVPIFSTGTYHDLLNLRVNGEVFQVPRAEGYVPGGNVIEGNVTVQEKLTLLGTRQVNILFAAGTHDSTIARNQASGGKYGIFNAGENFNQILPLPGHCSLSGNYCMTGSDVDCAAGEGLCTGEDTLLFDGRNKGNLIEGNVLPGPYFVGVEVAGQPAGGSAIQIQTNNLNPTLRGNIVTGDLANNTIPVGIGLTGRCLETARVERNQVSGAAAGLRLIQSQGLGPSMASFFGAKIFLNDFTGNGTNVKSTGIQPPLTPQPYTLATQLSVDDQGNVCGPGSSNCRGNYWGHPCDESGGFIEFGLLGADSDDADTVDSHAYGESVATQDPLMASICPTL